MKRFVLPTLLLLSCIPMVASAQDFGGQQQQTTASTATTAQPAMTPLQMDELRADILVARKLYPEAVSSYEKLVKEEPKNAVLLNKIGVACVAWGQKGCAEKYFKKSIKADKNYANPFNNLATVEYDKKHYKKAIELYDKSLELHMDRPATVYMNRGYAFFAEKQYPEAMGSFQQAIALDPTVFQEAGGFGSIVEDRQTADPGAFYFFLARTYAELGNVDRTAHYLKMARDDGYKKLESAKTDPAFAKVIKAPEVLQVFQPGPGMQQKQP
ncbi:MAG TPA: tetratricopeptide repeat protein [Candidatus Acidoferrales bacterium]|nr:tetratricopeptide repeat protein [Candidatus Acidoferrales bacterium]